MLKHSRSMGVVMSVLFLIQPVHGAYEWINSIKTREVNGAMALALVLSFGCGAYFLGRWVSVEDYGRVVAENSNKEEKLQFYKSNGLGIKVGPLGKYIDASEYMSKKLGYFQEATFKIKKGDNEQRRFYIQETLKEWGFIQERKEIKEDGGLLKKQVITQYTFFVPKIGNCDLKIEEID